MATKEKDTNKELEVEEIVSKSEQFIENNSKKIIYGIIAVALVVGAVLGIKHGYLIPQELTMKVSRLSSTNMEARTPETWRRLTQVSVTTRWAIHRRRSIY